MTLRRKTLFCSVPPSNSLISVWVPWRAFLADTAQVALSNNWYQPWLFVCWNHTCFHWSENGDLAGTWRPSSMKNQQGGYCEIVARLEHLHLQLGLRATEVSRVRMGELDGGGRHSRRCLLSELLRLRAGMEDTRPWWRGGTRRRHPLSRCAQNNHHLKQGVYYKQ